MKYLYKLNSNNIYKNGLELEQENDFLLATIGHTGKSIDLLIIFY